MRTSAFVIALLAFSLLFFAGCGGGEAEAPSGGEATAADTVAETTQTASASETPTLNITNSAGEKVGVEVEIADDPAEQETGLQGRTELAENAGMLFVFGAERPLSFWMRNTLIPLSIAYIDSGGRIVDIQDMEPLDDVPPNYVSAEPAQYALEVNQGFFQENGVEVGNEVELPRRSSSVTLPSAEGVIQAFRNAGLEVGEAYPVELEPGWEARPIPKSYEEASRFAIPSLGQNAGGRVFVFSSDDDLTAVRDYYASLGDAVRPRIYVEGMVLLQLNRQLSETEAEKYAAVLRGDEAPPIETPPADVVPPAEGPAEAPPDELPPDELPPADVPPDDVPQAGPPDEEPPAEAPPPGDVPPDEAPPAPA